MSNVEMRPQINVQLDWRSNRLPIYEAGRLRFFIPMKG